MDTVQTSATYLVRWPSWVGGIIALSLMAGLYAAVTEGVRRRYGSRAAWTAAFLVALAMGIFLAVEMSKAAEPLSVWLGFLALAVTVTAMFLAPAFGVWFGARRTSPTLAGQVGLGILAAYLFTACVVVVMTTIGWLIRR